MHIGSNGKLVSVFKNNYISRNEMKGDRDGKSAKRVQQDTAYIVQL